MMNDDEREKILSELVVQLIQSKRHREALDELELYAVVPVFCVILHASSRYLPSFPYQDNPVLHIHAGLICLYLAQPTTRKTPLPLPADIANTPKEGTSFNAILLREAQSHFEHTLGADPDNAVARGFLEKIPHFFENQQNRPSADGESEDDDSMALDDSPRRKRVRT
ncbi:hypothetical protein C0991_012098 [Blastosporella zonata]|nr:hypothetical protein C0991_012098 [Blastosporella zonata]